MRHKILVSAENNSLFEEDFFKKSLPNNTNFKFISH